MTKLILVINYDSNYFLRKLWLWSLEFIPRRYKWHILWLFILTIMNRTSVNYDFLLWWLLHSSPTIVPAENGNCSAYTDICYSTFAWIQWFVMTKTIIVSAGTTHTLVTLVSHSQLLWRGITPWHRVVPRLSVRAENPWLPCEPVSPCRWFAEYDGSHREALLT